MDQSLRCDRRLCDVVLINLPARLFRPQSSMRAPPILPLVDDSDRRPMIEGRVFACISVAAGIRTDSLVFPLPHTVLLGFPWGSLFVFQPRRSGTGREKK